MWGHFIEPSQLAQPNYLILHYRSNWGITKS